MTNGSGRGSKISQKSLNAAGQSQASGLHSSMYAQLIGHQVSPSLKKSLARPRALGSQQMVHKEINLQQKASQQRKVVILALPASTSAANSIRNQEASGHNQIAQGKETQEIMQQQTVALEDHVAILPPWFVKSATLQHEARVYKGGHDWSRKGNSYATPMNLHVEHLEPEIPLPQTDQSEDHYPQLLDFMNILKRGEDMTSSSANNSTNLEMMELRQDGQGRKEASVNTDLTLGTEEIDLTLRL